MVEKPLLDGGVADVPLIQLRAGAHEIQAGVGTHVPRQRLQALQVLAPANVPRVAAGPSGQPGDDLPGLRPHRRRKRGSGKAPGETVEPVGTAGIGPEPPGDLVNRDALADQCPVPGLPAEGHLPAHGPDVAAELPDARLARVVADDLLQGAPGEPEGRGGQAGRLVLRRDEMGRGDGDLLGLRVARQLDDLETVAQRRRDLVPVVRGRDEQDRGQVERQLDERVAEAPLLGRVEHLEEDRRRVVSDLVDLVEHEHRVSVAHAPQLAQDRTGLRTPPGAVVTPEVGLVAQPPAGQLGEAAPQGGGDTLGQRGLPDPRGADEAENRAAAGRVALPHGQMLDDAGLGGLEAGLPGVQRRPDACQIDRRIVAPRPRQVFEPLDPGVRYLGVGSRIGRQAASLRRDGVADERRELFNGTVPQELRDEGRSDHVRVPGRRGPRPHALPADVGELPVEIRDTGFIGVLANHAPDGVRLEADMSAGSCCPPRLLCDGFPHRRAQREHLQLAHRRNRPVHHHERIGRRRGRGRRCGRLRGVARQELPGRGCGTGERTLEQVLLGNGELLLLGVGGELDDVQVLQQRRRNGAGIGRRHDPQDGGQIERNLQVRVLERRPAPRVQDSQRRLDVILVDPVHVLDDEDRVVHPDVARARTIGPGPSFSELLLRQSGPARPGDTLRWVRPSASATASASDVLPIPRGPARQRTEGECCGNPGRTTRAGGMSAT